jgi:SOS-response transcriptional repressor LexA
MPVSYWEEFNAVLPNSQEKVSTPSRSGITLPAVEPHERQLQQRLRDLLQNRERKALAAKMRISEATLSRWYTGTEWRQPGVFTLKAFANEVGETVGSLLGEVDDVLTEDDRRRMIEFSDWLRERAQRFERSTIVAVDNVRQFPSNVRRDGDFPLPPIPIDDWIFKDTDRPQPLHAGAKPIAADVAAGSPSNPDDDSLIPQAQVLNSILREIRDPRVNVIRVAGHSMHPVLRNGWLVLVDPARALFQPGKVVMVYVKDEGTTIGLLAKNGPGYKIVKRNLDYGGPVEISLPEGEWYPVGTVTRIVDAPVEIE